MQDCIFTAMLLCDFHIHTKYSDGSLDMRKVVDIFGQSGFDVISITDHVVNGDNSMGKFAHRFKFSVTARNFNQYIEELKYEAKRAWDKYEMIVIPGVEISKNHLTADKSAHMLIIDVKEFIPACMSIEAILVEAKNQDALTVACHPHYLSDSLNKNTLYLWNHRDRYSRYIDAWEIGNRDELFNVVSLKKYSFVANSDFHKASHIYSWKTLLKCNKDIESVKRCIRDNRGVAITLFRN